jgi:hypothetical protein
MIVMHDRTFVGHSDLELPFIFPHQYVLIRDNQDSLVSIATDYGLDSQGSILFKGKRFSSSPTPARPDLLWGTPSLLSNGYGFFPWGKAAGSEVYHLPPSSSGVMNSGAIPLLHHSSSWHSA